MKKIDDQLKEEGYKRFPAWDAWFKPVKDENGKEVYLFIPGFRVATITDLDIYELAKKKET